MAIAPGITSDFEDGIQGWTVGGLHPNPPETQADTGPDGSGDDALLVQSNGFSGPGGRLAWFNTSSDWTGNFTSAGIVTIQAQVNNIGAEDVILRIALDGDGGGFASSTGVSVVAGSGWQEIEFSVQASDLAAAPAIQIFNAGTNIDATLANVTHVRLLHNDEVSMVGDVIASQLRIDDITALAVPAPSPNPTPDPDPSPTPSPSPAPDPSPSPDPTPSPNPTPSPDPVPSPSPDPAPSPIPGNRLLGTDADDKLTGDRADNEIQGGRGADVLRGQGGKDTLIGGAGKDTLVGGTGKDDLMGGGGKDTLRGGSGNDRLSGGGGGDTLRGDRGKDTLTGGGGKDTFVMRPKDGLDTITDFQDGRDRIQLNGKLRFDGLSFKQRGDDVLIRADNKKLLLVENTTVDDFSEADFV